MSKFLLSSDSSCDLMKSYLKNNGVSYVPLTFTVDGITYDDDFDSDEKYAEFYKMLEAKKMPTTSQITPNAHEEYFGRLIENGATDIVHLTLSSGLSNTYNSAVMGAAEAMGKHKGVNIYVVDSLSATQGQGYLLDEAIKIRDSGENIDEAVKAIKQTAYDIHHWFYADNLFHLCRGGRVSAVSAVLGSILKIKPVLIINNEGKLAVVHKAKGVRGALKYFTEQYEKYAADTAGDVYLPQADSQEVATMFKEELESTYGCKVKIGWVGPVIGAHVGGGMLGFVFRSKTGRLTNK